MWVKTFGCSHNVSDGEFMAGLLDSQGYGLVDDAHNSDAHLWLLNSCTVKDPSQSSFINLVRSGKEAGKRVVVAGCVPQGDRNLPGLEDVSVVGVQQIHRVVEVVEQELQGNRVRLLQRGALPTLDLPKIRRNPLVEIVPLSTGCRGSCTFCKTKHARGALGSYSLDAIVRRVQTAVADGVTEIWMSSEDTGAWGTDIGSSFPALLRGVLAVLPPDVMLRVGMTNPPYMLDNLPAIAECLKHPNAYRFLHIPLQAGSDAVLTAMNREYDVAEFRAVVDGLRAAVPDITISTDIIAGFPGETDAQWQDTMDIMRHYRFPSTHISKFYPRPGTPAATMRQLPTLVKKTRSRELTQLVSGFDPYVGLVDTTQRVWVSEAADGAAVGHTRSYVKVLLKVAGGGVSAAAAAAAGAGVAADPDAGAVAGAGAGVGAEPNADVKLASDLLGCVMDVHITRAMRWHVEGSVVPGTVRRVNVQRTQLRYDSEVGSGGAGKGGGATGVSADAGCSDGACESTACDGGSCGTAAVPAAPATIAASAAVKDSEWWQWASISLILASVLLLTARVLVLMGGE